MSRLLVLQPRNIVAILATIAAGAVAYAGKDGWGWLIFLAIVAVSE